MLAGADAGGRDRNRARVRLCGGDDVRQLAMRQILAADHHVTELVDQRDRHEILARIVGELRIQRRIERHVGEPADHQRVAIRLALACGLRADDGAGARLVLDDEGLPHPLRQRIRKLPPDQIVAAAGTDRDDDFNGTVGIAGLGVRCGNAAKHERECPCQRAANSVHLVPPSENGHRLALLGTMRHAASGRNADVAIDRPLP